MPQEIISKYVNAKRIEKGLTYEALANISGVAESTVKNICMGKSDDPRMSSMIPIMDAVDGSFDVMLFPGKHKEIVDESSIVALMSAIRETNGEHVHDIRTHYQEHRQDMKENYEKRLADKRELIESHKEHIKSIEKECRHFKLAFWICICVFVAVLIAELMNPNLGWFRY